MRQKGFVLFAVMVFLLIMSLLGATMFSGFIKDQKIAANLNEKQRAIDAAQTAQDYAQFWLQQPGNVFNGDWVNGIACSSSNQAGSAPVVCSNALANPAALPWSSTNTFQPVSMTVNANGGPNSYASSTGYYIQFLGTTPANPPTALYQVTSSAAGGNATAASVVQSIFQVTATARDVGGG